MEYLVHYIPWSLAHPDHTPSPEFATICLDLRTQIRLKTFSGLSPVEKVPHVYLGTVDLVIRLLLQQCCFDFPIVQAWQVSHLPKILMHMGAQIAVVVASLECHSSWWGLFIFLVLMIGVGSFLRSRDDFTIVVTYFMFGGYDFYNCYLSILVLIFVL